MRPLLRTIGGGFHYWLQPSSHSPVGCDLVGVDPDECEYVVTTLIPLSGGMRPRLLGEEGHVAEVTTLIPLSGGMRPEGGYVIAGIP